MESDHVKSVCHSNDFTFLLGWEWEVRRGFSPRAKLGMVYTSTRSLWLCCGELTVGGQCERSETGLEATAAIQVAVVMVWTRLLITGGVHKVTLRTF